jgi:hypothetical protein
MSSIKTAQHIYTNVEKKQSPHNRGGFQTLFHTHADLTRNEVSDMEPYLLYFPSESETVKKVFFTTETRKIVFGQIVPITAKDSAGRGGRYLAHSFIFTSEDFARLRLNPVQIFRHLPFVTDIPEALTRGDFETGNVPTVTLDFPEESCQAPETVRHWSVAEYKKLTRLALNAGRMAREKTAVAFTGNNAEIENALEAAFYAMPLTQRTNCSFDTYFYRCNLVATYYWGIGLERAVNPNLMIADAKARKVSKMLSVTDRGAYEYWVIAMIDADNRAHIGKHKETAFAVSEFLHSRPADNALLDTAPAEIVQDVFQAAQVHVREYLELALNKQLPALLTRRIFDSIYNRYDAPVLLDRLRHGFDQTLLKDTLFNLYAKQNGEKPETPESEALKQFILQNDHQNLRLLLAFWSGPEKLQRELKLLDQETYTRFVRQAMRFKMPGRLALLKRGDVGEALKAGAVTPLTMLVPGLCKPFVELYLGTYTVYCDWEELVKTFSEIGEAHCLSLLAPYIRELKAKEIRALKKIVLKNPEFPELFCQAVLEATEALPEEKGLRGVFRKLFR